MRTGVKVADVMRKSVVTVKPSDSVEKALRYMVELDIGSVLVADGHKPVGIITRGNLLERVFYPKKDPAALKASEVMSHPLRTIAPEDDLGRASEIMRDLHMKRLPVIKGGKILGIISEIDIISVSPALFEIISEATELRCGLNEREVKLISGVCEMCGSYSEELTAVQGALKCPACMEG